jgi:DNA-binding NarL/FixJ family response regulator
MAQLELGSAAQTFAPWAGLDLARVEGLLTPVQPAGSGPLTAREIQVLRLVANGSTNRIAGRSISEKTVARHVISSRPDLSSRAAPAHAFTHQII